MATMIYYIIDLEAKEFHFFEDGQHNEAKTKEKELMEKYGSIKSEIWKDAEFAPYPIEYKTLKNYYGTVWLAYKWSDSGAVAYSIQGRWNDIKHRRDDGYTIKKFELTPYEEYQKQFEEPEPKMDDSDIEELRQMLESSDLTKLEEEKKVYKRSPGFGRTELP